MARALLHSQFEALEEPGLDENPITVSIEPRPEQIVMQILSAPNMHDVKNTQRDYRWLRAPALCFDLRTLAPLEACDPATHCLDVDQAGYRMDIVEQQLIKSVESRWRANVRVQDFMTRPVVTITPDTTLLAAAKLMLEHRVGGLPVLDAAGRIIGVFSESDLLREEGEEGSPWLDIMVGQGEKPAASLQLDTRKVADVMTRQLITIAPDRSIAEACRLLHDHRLRRLPVVESDKLVGMIARVDLVRAVATSAEKASSAPTSDVSVDARLAEMERQIWRNRARGVRSF